MGRGKLVFKGEKKSKRKESSVKIKYDTSDSNAAVKMDESCGSGSTQYLDASAIDLPRDGDVAASTGDQLSGSVPDTMNNKCPEVKIGQGLIISSSTVISGHGTAFKHELRAGDALIVRNEMRVITMVLSNTSASISSSFSSDVRNPTQFNYINKPRDDKKEKAIKAEKARQEKEEVEQRAMGTYGNKGEIVYREKTEHGGYRIRKEKVEREMSRSDLLVARAGKKSDRYC